MAKKRKSTKGNNTLKHATASRINRLAGATSAKRTRYTEKYLTLALMGTAAFLYLKVVTTVVTLITITTATVLIIPVCRIVFMQVTILPFVLTDGTTLKPYFMPMCRRICRNMAA